MPDRETRRQERGEESRQALLQAGVELLREETLRDVLGALSSRSVAKRAQRSAGSFFHYWSSADAYVDDLLVYIFRAGLISENIDEIAADLEALVADRSDPVPPLRAILDANFSYTAGHPFFAVELLLRSRASSDQIRNGLREFYRRSERIIPIYETVGSSWGVEPRPPFDYTTMSVALTALLEGLTLRYLVDPERVPATLHADLVLAFLTVLLRRVGDSTTAPDLFYRLLEQRQQPEAR